MSQRRFEIIMKFLHFSDAKKQPQRGHQDFDKLYKIRGFVEALVHNFQTTYIPEQNLSIDESIIGFKGRLSWIQYLPKKPTKWGMKAWVLAESCSGYTWGWKLYTGKEESANSDLGLAHRVVLDLLKDLEGKGYIIYTDNFYSSPLLYADLKSRGFNACGTVRSNRKKYPLAVKTAKLQKGEKVTEHFDGMIAMKWKDKREVNMLSTFHDDSMVSKRRRTRSAVGGQEVISKPAVVEDYNQNMGGVDKSDQFVLYYGFAHRTRKWYRRVFFHMLDLSIVNAYILYMKISTSERKMTQLDFRISVARSLMDGHVRTPLHTRKPELPLRLTERPFIEPIPKTTEHGGRPNCHVCSKKKRKQTSYQCKVCKTPLCLYPCFEVYHTQEKY